VSRDKIVLERERCVLGEENGKVGMAKRSSGDINEKMSWTGFWNRNFLDNGRLAGL
jgi:hypothetical protein